MTATTQLPPTVNSLDPSQRARLLRSTRKLADVLGTTPHVIDVDLFPSQPSTPVHNMRKGAHFYLSPSASSSSSSFDKSSGSHESTIHFNPTHQQSRSHTPTAPPNSTAPKRLSWHKLTHPLVLRLRLSIDTNARPPAIQGGPFSVPTTLSSAPMSAPIVPDDEDKIRRKRTLAKLSRTLGECIPPELVLSQHKKSPLPTRRQSWDNWNQSRRSRLSEVASDSTPIHISRSVLAKCRRRSSSVGAMVLDLTRSAAALLSTEDAPSSLSTPVVHPASMTPQCGDDSNWSGEWNIKDAEERAMALRNLKC